MIAADAITQLETFLAEIGEDIAIRRFTGSGTPRPYTDTTTRARVMGYKPDQLIGPIVQGDRKVIASVSTLTGILPVTTNDKVVVGGRQLSIKAVDDNTRRIGGTLVGLELTVSG